LWSIGYVERKLDIGQKWYTAEQIIDKLRQAEVGLSKRRLELPELLPQL